MNTASRTRHRERLARSQDGICPACRLPLPEDLAGTQIDHVIPRIRGGPDLPWNRQLLHRACNRGKGFRLTDAAVVLAAEYGVILHLPIPASAHANRPFTEEESRQLDRLSALFYPGEPA